jgi:hypothetical protein
VPFLWANPRLGSLGVGREHQVVDLEQYQAMIGCLLYLERRTRPDILAPICILAPLCNSPTSYCHKAAKRILHTSVALGAIRFSMSLGVSI